MDFFRVLFGRTSEKMEAKERPATLRISTAGMTFETQWQDWKTFADGAAEMRGFHPIDPETHSHVFADELAPTQHKAGLHITPVAGISNYSARSLPHFAPGHLVHLVREPRNPYDKNAVAVKSVGVGATVGYLPRDLAGSVAPRMDSGMQYGAVVIFEFRKAGDNRRDGLRLFVGPDLTIETEGTP